MRGRVPAGRTLLAVLLAGAAAVPAAPAARPDKATERFLEDVDLLILPDEEKAYRALADPADRREFERIFWARRDPDPAASPGASEAAVARARERADELFSTSGRKGSKSDCGRLLVLLGDPAEVEGRDLKVHFDAAEALRGARRPEVWIYRSRPGDPVELTGGELRVALDEECRFAEGARVREDLRRVAASRVRHPELEYGVGPDGHLRPLAQLLRSGAGALPLDPARADFPLTLEPKLLMRTRAGESYAAGLLRADLAGLSGLSGAASSTATVSAQAIGPAGPPRPVAERTVRLVPGADGSFTAAYGLAVAPGRYTLRVGLAAGDKASVASTTLDVPDYDAPGLKLAPLLLYPDDPPAASATGADPQDPYASFTVGALHLRPRAGNAFTRADALQAVCVLYGGEADPATGKPSLRARLSLLKDGKPVARGQEETFDTATAVVSVGPVPLTSYTPGHYVARVEARDTVSGRTETQETPFEIAP